MAIRRPTAGEQRALLAVAEADFKKRRMNLAAVFVSSADRLGSRWLTK